MILSIGYEALEGNLTYPGPEVRPADGPHSRRQVPQRRHNSLHSGAHTTAAHLAVGVFARLEDFLRDGPAGDAAGEKYREGGNQRELLELRVAEGGPKYGDEVERADAVTQNIAKRC